MYTQPDLWDLVRESGYIIAQTVRVAFSQPIYLEDRIIVSKYS